MSPLVENIYFAPGNGGTGQVGENVDISPEDTPALVDFAKTHDVDLTVVGPEAPLANALVDRFAAEGLSAFGPTQKAARLENSKAWATDFMKRHGLPIPLSAIFTDVSKAKKYIDASGGSCVIKADGLCQGKGVYVCDSIEEAYSAVEQLMVKAVFGEAGKKIVIQKKLSGKEVSMMAFCDGIHAVPLIAAQDYKRIFDGDRGGNTGGMGSVTPATRVKPTVFKKIHRLLALTVDAMKKEGIPFHGILYAGIMVVGDDAYILEFNCRFGDPETQTQLPLLESDLYTILLSCVKGNLSADMVRWSDKKAVCVVVASGGYPGMYVTGKVIRGLTSVLDQNGIMIFHAGTAIDHDTVVSHGGRVLGVVATGKTVQEVREKIYTYIKTVIEFDGMYYRKDIGLT